MSKPTLATLKAFVFRLKRRTEMGNPTCAINMPSLPFKTFKVGGLRFIRLGKLSVSFCITHRPFNNHLSGGTIMTQSYAHGEVYNRRPVIALRANEARVNMALTLLAAFAVGCGLVGLVVP